MKNNSFEKLKNGVWKKIIIGSTCLVAVLSVGIFATSHAKYKLIESINIVNGTINYKVPDLKVMAMYKSENGTNYTEITSMPESGYIINEENTYCTTDNVNQVKGKIKTVNGIHGFTGLNKGEKCYLYFDKKTPGNIEELIASLNAKTTTPSFGTASTTDEGVYKVSDGMYGGNSYYWRGAVTNNYVKFANFCWRIVRINGDGSLRLIFDGTTCHTNGQSTSESIATANVAYNLSVNQSNYVGWTYTGTSQRTTKGTASNLKTKIENWYKINIADKGYNEKVANGKYCNDRDVQSGSTWVSTGTNFNYAAYNRTNTNVPTLSCPSGDTYTLNVGLITVDEVMYAGGKEANNKSYYLYNGQNYWTMSPCRWYSSGSVSMLVVNANGSISVSSVDITTRGIRPVINLNADITFSSGDGQKDTPFIVN